MKKVSIVVPVYNAEQYLDGCIKSVLVQTLEDFELILVNDGSTDRSGEICEQYKEQDSRIQVLHKENGGGAGATRNFGLATVSGEYVTFMDADDWMQPDMLDKMYLAAKKADVDVVICGYRYIFDENRQSETNYDQFLKKQEIVGKEEVKKFFVTYFPDGLVGYPWNKLYRVETIKRNQLQFPLMRRMQDGIFNLHFFGCADSCLVLQDSLYNYRASQAITKKKLPSDFYDLLESFTKQYYTELSIWKYNAEEVEAPMVKQFLNELVSCVENIYINEKMTHQERQEKLMLYHQKDLVQYMLNRTSNITRYSKIVLDLYKKKRFGMIFVLVHLKYFLKTNMYTLFMKLKKVGN